MNYYDELSEIELLVRLTDPEIDVDLHNWAKMFRPETLKRAYATMWDLWESPFKVKPAP